MTGVQTCALPISVDGNNVGDVKVVEFKQPNLLIKEGQQRFQWTGDGNGATEVKEPHVKAGHLEKSNVNAIDEMVKLIGAYREFESIQHALRTTSNEMNSKLIQELGKLS